LNFLIFQWWERETGFMPASRQRSISPLTEKVKPTLTHKNFGRAGSSAKAATPINFRAYSCFFVVKK
jgi:hypothetical protein